MPGKVKPCQEKGRAKIEAKREQRVGELLGCVMPQDLLRYGLIPEFIGRLPIVVPIEPLTETDLVTILVEPRNALVRQYQKILEMDGVELIVAENALRAIAREAMTRHTGARGLRTVLEEIMLNIMYEIPSRSDIKRCVVTEDTVAKRVEPLLVTAAELKKMLKEKPA